MGVLKKIRGWFSRKSADSRETDVDRLLTFLGVDKSKPEAINEATYFACLRLLSESVGKLPLKLMQCFFVLLMQYNISHTGFFIILFFSVNSKK